MQSLAQTLPYCPLLNIFSYLGRYGRVEGGEFIDWTSHSNLTAASTVCRGWWLAAQTELFRSVSIRGAEQGRLFLRTIRERPELANFVKSLVLALDATALDDETHPGSAEASQVLLGVLAACPNVKNLQVRPLHDSVRSALINTIATRPLHSLVLAPRLTTSGEDWSRYFWATVLSPARPTLTTLRRLEIDYWTRPAAPTPPSFDGLRLEVLRIACEIHDEMLFALLNAAGSTLIVADIYLEHVSDIPATATSLSQCTPNIISLRFISNPTIDQLDNLVGVIPLFDRLLPHFRCLESLYIAASDVSINLFRLLPPCLKDLEIQELSHISHFYFDQQLLDDLYNPELQVHLESLTLRDVTESWDDDEADLLRIACLSRGIYFSFMPGV